MLMPTKCVRFVILLLHSSFCGMQAGPRSAAEPYNDEKTPVTAHICFLLGSARSNRCPITAGPRAKLLIGASVPSSHNRCVASYRNN